MRKKHSRYKNISWRKTRKEERKAKEKTSLFPKEDSLENKQARQRISPPRSANDLLASLAGWRVGNSRFSRGRKRIVDGTVRSLIPSESREEVLAASYLLRSIELLLHLLLLLLSRPPPSSFHFCSFSSRFSPRSISSFSTLTPPRIGRSVGAVLVFKDLITDLLAHSVLWNATLVSVFFLAISIFSSFSTFFLSSLASHALSSSSFSSSSSSSRLGLLLTKVCGHPPFPRKRNERQRGKEA